MNESKDNKGNKVSVGATVRLLIVPEELIYGLPESDQLAIQSIVGREITVEDIDENGKVELKFEDQDKTIHFIWVSPSAVQVTSSALPTH
jgi:hypothetical protein